MTTPSPELVTIVRAGCEKIGVNPDGNSAHVAMADLYDFAEAVSRALLTMEPSNAMYNAAVEVNEGRAFHPHNICRAMQAARLKELLGEEG